jgi:hypothetical protein
LAADDGKFAGERRNDEARLSENAVPPQQIASAPAHQAILGCRARAQGRRMTMDGACPWGQRADAACATHPQRQVEVLEVREDPLVEAADPSEHLPLHEGCGSGRPERGVGGAGRLGRLSVKVVPRKQRPIRDDARGVDEVRSVGLKENAGDGVCAVGSLDEGLDELRLALDIVVEEDEQFGWTASDSDVQRPSEADVLLETDHAHAELLGSKGGGVIA